MHMHVHVHDPVKRAKHRGHNCATSGSATLSSIQSVLEITGKQGMRGPVRLRGEHVSVLRSVEGAYSYQTDAPGVYSSYFELHVDVDAFITMP
jgi:hypothetical protein